MRDIIADFCAGAFGFLVLALLILGCVLFWPYSGYAVGALVSVVFCIGLGGELRSGGGTESRGP
jgi:hypothetical protein